MVIGIKTPREAHVKICSLLTMDCWSSFWHLVQPDTNNNLIIHFLKKIAHSYMLPHDLPIIFTLCAAHLPFLHSGFNLEVLIFFV